MTEQIDTDTGPLVMSPEKEAELLLKDKLMGTWAAAQYGPSFLHYLDDQEKKIKVAEYEAMLERVSAKVGLGWLKIPLLKPDDAYGPHVTHAGTDSTHAYQMRWAGRDAGEEGFEEVRVAVLGNVDAGKSTLLGVLTRGALDDGRGKARACLFRHKHEQESGRTSSVCNELLGFRVENEKKRMVRVPALDARGHERHWDQVCSESDKIVSFMDLAGHEKYLKTTMFGLTGHLPDYSLFLMGANAGLIGMAKEHLALTFALNLPLIVVMTKMDMTPVHIAQENLARLTQLLKSPSCGRVPIVIKNTQECLTVLKHFLHDRYCPIFQVSNVSGTGMALLSQFLSLLPTRSSLAPIVPPSETDDASGPSWQKTFVEFPITEVYVVPGVGTVVSGVLLSGVVTAGQTLYLGPEGESGAFQPTQVKSIQRKRLSVDSAHPGQAVTFALKKVKRSAIRKGMLLLSLQPPFGKPIDPTVSASTKKGKEDAKKAELSMAALGPNLRPFPMMAVCREFSAEVLILFHATTISMKYQAMLHCHVIRQSVTLVAFEQIIRKGASAGSPASEDASTVPSILRTGDRAVVRFRFVQHPECLKVGARLLFREGRTKGVGKIVALHDTP